MSFTMLVDSTRIPVLHLSSDSTDKQLPQSEVGPSHLLDLPDELKLQIVNYIHRKRDLLNLALTCRELEDLAVKGLYNNVDVKIPQSKYNWHLGKLPVFRPHVLRAVQTLAIRNGTLDLRDPIYTKRRRSDAGSVDGYVCDLIEHVPKHQLASFSLFHQTPLSLKMLGSLTEHHGDRLEHLCCFEIESLDKASTSPPRSLRTLECRSLSSGESLVKVVKANQQTLESLHLGQEKELIEQYRRNRIGFMDQISQPLDGFRAVMDLSTLPKLRSLSLVGLDVTPFLPGDIRSALLFCNLESLVLESCAGATGLLDTLASTFHYAQHSDLAPQAPRRVPRLKLFLFRHEAFTNTLKDALINFMTSFSGLESLSLLFENATLVERPSTLIAKHGPTLRTLVMESRIQPREHLGLDTSRPFGIGGYSQQLWQESINDICTHCPNLVELGMGFPWDDEMVRLRPTQLPGLKDLKTIHIRNFPQNQVLSQLGEYHIKEYSQKFIEWCFPSLVGRSRPSLETLAIGPTLYESRWKCGPAPSSAQSTTNYRKYHNPPEYLRTHYYCLDWAKTRFGRWNAMITPVTESYMEETREEKPLGGVFQQVWLK